jgi:adenylosuccinate lyase
MEAANQVKMQGKRNDLIERIVQDGTIGMSEDEMLQILKPE